MNRMWKEPFLLMLLGLASIGVVLSIRQLLHRPSAGTFQATNSAALRRQVEESTKQISRLEGRLRETDEKLKDLELPSETSEHTEPKVPEEDRGLGSTAVNSLSYQEALARAWEYLQSGSFDPSVHKDILSGLEKAYAEKGLPSEANWNLVDTMRRMNDLGVSAVIDEAKGLPPKEAHELLEAFLHENPKLSERQRSRINGTLRRQGSGTE